MKKFEVAPPAALRTENGAKRDGDSVAGSFVTRGHKYTNDKIVKESEDFITFVNSSKLTVVGVFDGHGGTSCPRAVGDYLVSRVAKCAEPLSQERSVDLFHEAQSHLAAVAEKTLDTSGTTATVAVINKDTIKIIFVGDSQALLVDVDGYGIFLTGTHRPCDERERARIEQAGGFVSAPSGSDDVHRVNGVYGVSRCLGNVGVDGAESLSTEPDFVVYERKPTDKLLLIATDGVWDFVTVEAVAKVACEAMKQGQDMPDVALAVAKRAYVNKSSDDIAVFAYRLEATPPIPPSPSTISAVPPPEPLQPLIALACDGSSGLEEAAIPGASALGLPGATCRTETTLRMSASLLPRVGADSAQAPYVRSPCGCQGSRQYSRRVPSAVRARSGAVISASSTCGGDSGATAADPEARLDTRAVDSGAAALAEPLVWRMRRWQLARWGVVLVAAVKGAAFVACRHRRI
eukprot:jgi/Ulvmu1/12780/UM097_0007.1